LSILAKQISISCSRRSQQNLFITKLPPLKATVGGDLDPNVRGSAARGAPRFSLRQLHATVRHSRAAAGCLLRPHHSFAVIGTFAPKLTELLPRSAAGRAAAEPLAARSEPAGIAQRRRSGQCQRMSSASWRTRSTSTRSSERFTTYRMKCRAGPPRCPFGLPVPAPTSAAFNARRRTVSCRQRSRPPRPDRAAR